jgi:hypothetical protein
LQRVLGQHDECRRPVGAEIDLQRADTATEQLARRGDAAAIKAKLGAEFEDFFVAEAMLFDADTS